MTEEKVQMIEKQMKFHELQALWWIASATTGHCQSKIICHGFGDKEFTPQEKTNDAMETAQRHIHSYREFNDILMSEKF